MEDLSQGTFDLIWEDLNCKIEPNQVQQQSKISELTNIELVEMSDLEMAEFFENDPFNTEGEILENKENIPLNNASNNMNNPSKPLTASPVPGPSTEFLEFSSEDVRKFIENEDNKNTSRKTLSDVQKFQRFLQTKGEQKEIQNIEADILDEYIANYILSVRKPDGQEYEPSTIRNIISSLDRKLKRHKYPFKIIADNTNAFQLTRDALTAKQKSLKRLGKGNKPMKASPITDDEINILYEKGILGSGNAQALLNTTWLNNCILFGLRGTKENYDLR